MPENAIVIEKMSKRFGDRAVFDQCSYTIAKGSIFGLVGLNGAGKTTLIRLLSGLLKPDEGELSVLGLVPWDHEEHFYSRLGIVLESDGFSGNMNCRDNLKVFAAAKGLSWAEVESYIHAFWKDTFIDREMRSSQKKVKFFSRGQRVQCGLCRAFLGWPDAYFFDEPTVALDVEAYDHFCEMVRHAKKQGSTILISSHQLSFIEELCDEVGVLDKNKLSRLAFVQDQIGTAQTQQWTIVGSGDSVFQEIIQHQCGHTAVYSDGAWHFEVDQPQTIIPEIVTMLCKAGCRIMEMRPEKQELKDKIRSHYEKI
jgi:ABC-type multidrug transport system ATPase subunit